MDDILEKNIKSWSVWLEFEKRVSKNTVISYKSDLISFLRFFKEYENQKESKRYLLSAAALL